MSNLFLAEHPPPCALRFIRRKSLINHEIIILAYVGKFRFILDSINLQTCFIYISLKLFQLDDVFFWIIIFIRIVSEKKSFNDEKLENFASDFD